MTLAEPDVDQHLRINCSATIVIHMEKRRRTVNIGKLEISDGECPNKHRLLPQGLCATQTEEEIAKEEHWQGHDLWSCAEKCPGVPKNKLWKWCFRRAVENE